ncbi:chitinase [Andreprevotia lacus DSM 23236]|jgi:chitinase|uniref:Chitinase n=1 Tax=Andreprevotia lacus DSM 23236 TaxID=1121001 RepID=A0A1W1WXB1_9NEIS|nr:glycosyl hydrolase family 18 protein [Andreprevotia lacus]SMC16362.1 chitinase [Andreprevotia lacus DSM 23236]
MSMLRYSMAALPLALAAVFAHAAYPAWQEGTTYTAGTYVSYNGHDYQALVTHTAYVGAGWTPSSTPTLWKDLGVSSGSTPTATPAPTAAPTATPVPVTNAPTATPKPTATPAPTTAPTATPAPSAGCYQAWNSGTAYNGGAQVTYNGRNYTAKWWTQNNIPSSSNGDGQPWTDNGPCGSVTPTTAPTTTPKPTTTPVPVTATPVPVTATPVPVTGTPVPTVTPKPTATPVPVTGTPVPTATPVPSGANDACRPDGMVSSVANVPYCQVYDANGREILPNGLSRRIVGYFTNWRHGADGQPTYLVNNLPWNMMSHINYAFATVDQNKYTVQIDTSANSPDIAMTWPGVAGAQMDDSLPYKGHFNLLAQYKKQHPGVRALLSVGGWAGSTGFYTMTTNADGTVNTAGINTFADSVVAFLRQYPAFDGIDIDYEHPSTDTEAGAPADFTLSQPRLKGLMTSYKQLMQVLRQKLDTAAVQDNKYYFLSIAGSGSGWVLRGEENLPVLQYLDFVNVMSYDLHGTWNQYVGPNSALFDDGKDAELIAGAAYQYQNIGYLNVDWAYHYYRGAMQSGRINMGIPYYTNGWKTVTGGTNGLWGTAPIINDAVACAGAAPCGGGASGIDNVWYDLDTKGNPVAAGGNPVWHALNLTKGIVPDYLDAYKVTDKSIVGSYQLLYDPTLVASWVWNANKQVFLSVESEQTINTKADYIVKNGIGGAMIWEMAGDYAWDASRNGGKGEYYMGNTFTTDLYNKFKGAAAYGSQRANGTLPPTTANVAVNFSGWKLGDDNYPFVVTMNLVNNTAASLPAGTVVEFDVPVSAPSTISSTTSAVNFTVTQAGYNGPNNIGGFKADFNHAKFTLAKALAAGGTLAVKLSYDLPISGPSNYVITVGGNQYRLAQDYPLLPVGLK